ncbi:HlyD family secretion protein [Stenotrophomonas geniculata]|uniref:HlyD family secretion protein n=1 Tax=Stenotrophomonas geniculata TaxID=86188 RepID=UPI002ACD6FAB|nr:HlyD family efflux transporter periplasmic adaptor subunit [Stenotrophomonas geniculata]
MADGAARYHNFLLPSKNAHMDVGRTSKQSPALFREALRPDDQRRHDVPLDGLGFGWRSTALFFLLLTGVVVAVAATARFPRKERAQGEISTELGTKRVTATRQGVVSAIHVKPDEVVRKGQSLLSLSYDRTVDGISIGNRSLEAARRQMVSRVDSLGDTAEVIRQKIHEVELESAENREQVRYLNELIALKEMQISDKQRTVEAMGQLTREKIVSELQFRAARGELLDQQQQLVGLKRERGQMLSKIGTTESSRRQLEHQASSSESMITAETAAFDEKEISLRASSAETLTAPMDGRVSSRIASLGESVQPGASLMIIAATDEPAIGRAWVRSSAIGFLKPGSEARLKVSAFPYRKFGTISGTVREVAKAPTPVADLPRDLNASEAMYAITISLSSNHHGSSRNRTIDPSMLGDGMKFDVDLMMERRTLLEMLLDPARTALSGLE